jgi:hypothetical protein
MGYKWDMGYIVIFTLMRFGLHMDNMGYINLHLGYGPYGSYMDCSR